MSDVDNAWHQKSSLYLLVGQGISMWAATEGFIASIFASLMGSSPEKAGLVIYSINNFYTWLSIIDDLISIDDQFTSIKSEWGQIAEKLKSLNDIRVRLAHHTSFSVDPPVHSEHPSLRPSHMDTRSKSRKHRPLSVNEINVFCDDLDKILNRLVALQRATETLSKKSGE